LVAAAPVMAGSTEENRSAAQSEAQALVAAAVLPTDATRLSGKPDGDGDVLANPGTIGSNPNLALSTAWYRSGLSVADVLAFFDAHPPAGATLFISGGGETRDGHRAETRVYQRPRIRGSLETRWLVVGATKLDDGSTGIRLDGYVVWLIGRSPGMEITGARHLTINSGRHKVVVRDPARVARIAAMLNALDVEQPGIRMCQRAPLPEPPHPRLTFRDHVGGKVIAYAHVRPSGCGRVDMVVGGKRYESLDLQFAPGPKLLKTLKKLGAL
jgi:hypothetical protein